MHWESPPDSTATCTVTVAFTPSAGEDRRGTLTLAGSASGGPVARVALDGTGLRPAQLAFSPASLAFGAKAENTTTAAQTLTLRNSGDVATTLRMPVLTGEYIFVAPNTCGSTLDHGAACTITVEFAPISKSSQPGTLAIASDSGTLSATATLSGTGLALVLSPATLPFAIPLLIGQSETSARIGSSGTASQNGPLIAVQNLDRKTPMALEPPSITGDFAIASTTCGPTLPPDTSCALNISFTPTAGGQRTGLFTVSDGDETQSTQLTGTGLTPATDTLSTSALVFSSTEVGKTSAAQAVIITNSGDDTLRFDQTKLQATGPFTVSNNCGGSLGGHSSCSIAVKFTPQATGDATGVLRIPDTISNAQHTQTVTLSGNGAAPPQAFASPSNINFGPYAYTIATPPQVVTISNQGQTTMAGIQAAINGSDFAVSSSNCGATLAPGASCQIGIVFTPGVIGNREGTLAVTSSAVPLIVSLTGSGEDYQFSVVGSGSSVITNGQIASYHLSLTPTGTSAGNIAITCSGAPANSICAANPPTVQIAGGVTGSITLSVATAAPATPTSAFLDKTGRWWAGGTALALLCPMFLLPRSHRRTFLLAIVALALLSAPIACGVHASGVNSKSSPQPGQTPSGNYTLTVTATFPGAQRTATVNLVVQ